MMPDQIKWADEITRIVRERMAMRAQLGTPSQRARRFIRRGELLHTLNVSSRTLRRWVEGGTFPPPDLIPSARVCYWKRETVEAWLLKTEAEAAANRAAIVAQVRETTAVRERPQASLTKPESPSKKMHAPGRDRPHGVLTKANVRKKNQTHGSTR